MLQPDKWKLHLENESTSWLISQKNESKKSRSTARWLLHGAAAGGGTRYGKLALDTRYPVNLPSEKKSQAWIFIKIFFVQKIYTTTNEVRDTSLESNGVPAALRLALLIYGDEKLSPRAKGSLQKLAKNSFSPDDDSSGEPNGERVTRHWRFTPGEN